MRIMEIVTERKSRKELINLTLFTLGQLISVFGSVIYTFAIGLHVLRITGSGLSFAITLGFSLVATIIFSPIAGVLADRMDKKKIIVSMDIMNGILFLVVYMVIIFWELDLWIIYTSAFLTRVFTTIFGISMESAKPNIVSDKNLMNINSASRIIDSVASIAGPVVGGIVFALIDIKLFILFNGISFIISGISEMFIDFEYNDSEKEKSDENEKEEEVKGKFIKDIKEGISYIKRKKELKGIFSIFISLNFFISIAVTVPLPYIINNVIGLSSKQFGVIEGFLPVGMIIGALIVKKVTERISYSKLLILMSIILAFSMILIGLPLIINDILLGDMSYSIYYSGVMLIFGVAISLIDIPILYLLQKVISKEFRGRILSLSMSISKLVAPGALILSGLLLNILHPSVLPIVGGGSLLVLNIFILKLSKITELDLE